MDPAELRLGTSSWTADGWVGSFYPDNCKPADFLPFYAERFNTVEIDSTFYCVPTAKTVHQWREKTPNGFVFAAKLPQIITHQKVLIDAESDLKEFLGVMDNLGDKLGPLLLQFPYFNHRKFRGLGFFIERLQPFLEGLPEGYQWAVEIRNKNWMSKKFYSVLRNRNVALALVNHPWMPLPKELFDTGDPVTADFTYIRWLGDRKGIEDQTTVWSKTLVDRTGTLREWTNVIRQLQQRGLRIFAFANNHYAGFAPATVDLFRELWDQNQTDRKKPSRENPSRNLEFNF
jgi:uncharacterized protein YecE (DUF72 family)